MSIRPSRTSERLFGGASGVSATVVGLAVAELVAGFGQRLRSPLFDVGDRVIDRVPGFVKDLAIEIFGTNDKVALLLGMVLTLVVYGCMVGVQALRRGPLAGDVGIVAFTAIGVLASVLNRNGLDLTAALPSLGGGLAAAIVLRVLVAQADPAVSQRADAYRSAVHPGSRRRFLVGLAATTAGAGVVGGAGRRLQARFDPSTTRAGITLPTASQPLSPVPPDAQAPGADSFITANADFYRIDTALTVPRVDINTWKLSVAGMVDNSFSVTYEDLLDRPLVEHDITLTCVSNTVGGKLVGNARWLGVLLADLLAEAGIDPTADQIVGRSVDGYTCGFPTAALDGRPAMIAIGMNGEPLPLDHGYPARLVVPGIYGYASATKWLSEIELTTFDAFDHYWVPRGYAAEAPIKLQSRIDSPRGLDRIDPGPFAIGGVAWAQTIGIDGVEVRIDDGPWTKTDLAAEVADTTWRQWSLPWEATPGRHTIEVRAKSRNGAIQTPNRSEPLPDGASGHHKVVVLVNA